MNIKAIRGRVDAENTWLVRTQADNDILDLLGLVDEVEKLLRGSFNYMAAYKRKDIKAWLEKIR